MNDNTRIEEWRPVSDSDRPIAVSNFGRLMYLTNPSRGKRLEGQIVKQHITPLGYHYIHTISNGKRCKPYVHVIVAKAFLGEAPDGLEVNHIDRDKSNNTVSNLEYVTRRENMLHSYADIYLCPRRINRKVTPEQVQEMAELYRSGRYLQREIAEMYGISAPRVSQLISAA